ncbi:hypothetical protein D9756_003128 [Leucocoprinus leucothites]|uniref:Major facilitator superfamily (MFS) profile domain-containing protein n=1 Tax=Leucocoprinus leucothites TaxID=201217 RepID=A0A8H5G756_9AGAR|nr:hypothetical protein D9756_003128 [Leucoagaricus leucothites]
MVFGSSNSKPGNGLPGPSCLQSSWMSLQFKERIRGVSLIFACGTALFSDGNTMVCSSSKGYANGVISSVNTLLTRIYGDRLEDHNYGTIIRSVTFAGTVVGMVIFGWLSDKVGRKFGMMSAAGIVLLFSGLSAASKGANGSLGGMLSMLSAMRFLLGIGIGAEYPCGSVSASEQSEGPQISKFAQHRWLALATNCMIDLGFVIAAFVPLVLFWMFVHPIYLERREQTFALQIRRQPPSRSVASIFGIRRRSCIAGLPLATEHGRTGTLQERLDETCQDSVSSGVEALLGSACDHLADLLTLTPRWLGSSMISLSIRFVVQLASTIIPLIDELLVQFSIYSSTILDRVTGGNESLTVIFGWNVVINLFYMPGTFGGAFILDYLGPKYTLVVSLLLQAVIGFIMSGLYERLTSHIAAFAVVYGIFLSLGELGPGNCTMILASKTSPTAVRGQFYGVAAAIGKVGAFVGTWAFPPMIDAFGGPKSTKGNTGPFWVGSGLAILSALIALLLLRPMTHDGMIAEDIAFRQYLEENGYDTSSMGLLDGSTTASEVVIDVKAGSFEKV